MSTDDGSLLMGRVRLGAAVWARPFGCGRLSAALSNNKTRSLLRFVNF